MLGAHPRVSMPSVKEPWFFNRPDFAQRWDWFRGLFPGDLSAYDAIGDDSNEYSSFNRAEDVAETVTTLYPGARFVFLARDPAVRVESAYRHAHDDGVKHGFSCPFVLHEAMEAMPSLLHNANFWNSISPYRALVPPDRIHVAHLEDLSDEPSAVMRSILEFLGVDPTLVDSSSAPRLNTGDGKFRDTRLLRRMRSQPLVGPRLARLNYEEQERLLRPLLLRRRFPTGHRPHWTPKAVEMLRDVVLPGARLFAQHYGMPRRGWPRMAELTGFGAPPLG